VLIDGHRVTSNSRSIDPSVLPSLGVERVEVVADGASAIYGSDAVAGVVNIIPRRSLDGGEVFGRAGISDDGAFHEYALGGALGKVFDRGQIMVASNMLNAQICQAMIVRSSPATSASPAVAITGSCAAHRAISMPTARLMQSPLAG
jgi:outer membrane receptor protein involved in Fe transport